MGPGRRNQKPASGPRRSGGGPARRGGVAKGASGGRALKGKGQGGKPPRARRQQEGSGPPNSVRPDRACPHDNQVDEGIEIFVDREGGVEERPRYQGRASSGDGDARGGPPRGDDRGRGRGAPPRASGSGRPRDVDRAAKFASNRQES